MSIASAINSPTLACTRHQAAAGKMTPATCHCEAAQPVGALAARAGWPQAMAGPVLGACSALGTRRYVPALPKSAKYRPAHHCRLVKPRHLSTVNRSTYYIRVPGQASLIRWPHDLVNDQTNQSLNWDESQSETPQRQQSKQG